MQSLAPGYAIDVLIADDVAENRQVLQQLLEYLGATVRSVTDGQQVLDALGQQRPDLVLLDIRMPVLDGQETLQQIRQSPVWSDLKVVALSASTLAHQRQAMLEAGFDGFIGKPFRFEEVCRYMTELLDVEFTRHESPIVEAGASEQDWQDLALPAALVARLRQTARVYSVTELEEAIQELEGLGSVEASLGAHLRTLRQDYNMQGIIAALDEVTGE